MDTAQQARHAEILAEVAEIAMAAARELSAALPEAETAQDKACLATALNRTLRGVRQTLALEARLTREAVRAGREDAAEARSETRRQGAHRKARIGAAVERLIWREYEAPESEHLALDLSDLLDAEALSDSFLADPLETQVTRVCEELGISLPAHPREGGDPSRVSALQAPPDPSAAWIPACAGTSGGGADDSDPTFDASG